MLLFTISVIILAIDNIRRVANNNALFFLWLNQYATFNNLRDRYDYYYNK